MPLSQPLYIDAPTFSQATGVFLDAGLTVCAPNGYYSDGTIARYQAGCVLGFVEPCPLCGLPCDGPLLAESFYSGYLITAASAGETATDVGAIIIRLTPTSGVVGIMAQADFGLSGFVYNKLSSSNFGLLTGTAGLPIFIGDSAADCGISGSTYLLPEYGYDGTTYVATGDTISTSITAGQVSTTAGDPGMCVMVIPKLTPTPSGLTITNITPCADTSFNIEVLCPRLLDQFGASVVQEEIVDTFCDLPTETTYYVASVNGTGSYPFGLTLGLYDMLFYDPYGQYPLSDGYYKTFYVSAPNDTIQVQNGVIISITNNC